MKGVIQQRWYRDFAIGIRQVNLLLFPVSGKTVALFVVLISHKNNAKCEGFETVYGSGVSNVRT